MYSTWCSFIFINSKIRQDSFRQDFPCTAILLFSFSIFIFSSLVLVGPFSSSLHLYEWGHTPQDWTTEPWLSSGYDITIRAAVIPASASFTAVLVISISLNPGHMAANAHCSAFHVLHHSFKNTANITKTLTFLFLSQNPTRLSVQSNYVMQLTQICHRKYRTGAGFRATTAQFSKQMGF